MYIWLKIKQYINVYYQKLYIMKGAKHFCVFYFHNYSICSLFLFCIRLGV